VASGEQRVVFAEVKNWSIDTWLDRSKRNGIEEQLTRHNEGIDDILTNKSYTEDPAKLLMVRKEGYEGLLEDDRKRFEAKLHELGWSVERIPDDEIPSFSDLLASLQ